MNTDSKYSDPFDFSYEPWVPPPVDPEHHYFKTDDGIRLHYVRWPSAHSDAPVIVMVHGRRAHCHWFDPVIPALYPQFECVSLDLRGHGDSECKGVTDMNRYAADVAQFYTLFEGRKRALFVHSMAGRVAILVNENHGIVPDGLIMADTPLLRKPHHDRPEPRFVNKKYPDRETMLMRFRLMPPGTSANPELLHHISLHAVKENEDRTWSWKFSEDGTSLPTRFQIPDFSEMKVEGFTCPALIIYGEKSALLSADEAQTIAERFPNHSTVEIPDAYHHLMFDHPSRFNGAVLEFLKGVFPD